MVTAQNMAASVETSQSDGLLACVIAHTATLAAADMTAVKCVNSLHDDRGDKVMIYPSREI